MCSALLRSHSLDESIVMNPALRRPYLFELSSIAPAARGEIKWGNAVVYKNKEKISVKDGAFMGALWAGVLKCAVKVDCVASK